MKVEIVLKKDILPPAKRRKWLFIPKNHLEEMRSMMKEEPFNLYWQRFINEISSRIRIDISALPTGKADTSDEIASYYSVFRSCLNDILNASFAFLMTRDLKYAALARDRIRTALSWYTWVHPAHYPKTIDLISGEILRALAIACDWLGSSLPPDERATISDTVQNRVISQYVTGMMDQTGWWVCECTTNWCAVVNGGIGSSLLYFLEDNSLLCEILNEIIRCLSIYLKEFDPDGGWIEGIMYWAYGITWYLYLADALMNATQGRINLTNIPQMKNAGSFPLYSYLPPDGMVNFCDSLPKINAGLSIPLFRLAREFKEPSLLWLASRMHVNSNDPITPYFFIWAVPGIEMHPPQIEPRAKIFKRIEWAIAKSSWDDEAVILAAKAGYADPYEHTHLDAGTFLLNAFGKSLISELGKGPYTRDYFSPKRWENPYANCSGHNTYIIGGYHQLPLKEHNSRITDFQKGRRYNYMRMDISSCYPSDIVKLLIRHFVLVDELGCIILDEISCKEGTTVEGRLHFTGSANSISADSFHIKNDSAELIGKLVCNTNVQIGKFTHNEPEIGFHSINAPDKTILPEYIGFSFVTARSKSLIAAFLHPFKASNKSPGIDIKAKINNRILSILIIANEASKTLVWSEKNGKNVLDSII